MSALPRWYNAERQAARLDRALRRVMREVFSGKLTAWDERGAIAELEFLIECACDGYKLEPPGRPGDAWLDRKTLPELFEQAAAWNIETVTATWIIKRCQGRRR